MLKNHAQLDELSRRIPWFGPHAILEAVEWLVVNHHHKAAAGWSWEEIKASLLMQQKVDEKELPQDLLDVILRAELSRLVQMGDLKVVEQQPYRYTLSPPYLPPWFDPDEVLKAVGELDKDNAGGSTWEEIRDSLKEKHPAEPLPPEFDTVLRTLLSIFHQKGHLAKGANGPRHYTRRQAPALVPVDHPDSIRIPDYVWWYYLGYKLRPGVVLDHPDSGDEEDDAALMPNNPNAPPWLGLLTVLQEIERLDHKLDKSNTTRGWTCEQIRESLMRTRQQDLPQGFDDALRATLVTLYKRRYLTKRGYPHAPRYRLCITPVPFPFPTWFRPEAVLQAVGVIDDANNNDSGSTSADIRSYFMSQHGDSQWPSIEFDRVLRTMLSVLRQRGRLTRGSSGPRHYTRRGAPVPGIGIPDNLLSYYAGHKLAFGRFHRLDDGEELSRKPISDVVGMRSRPSVKKSANNPAGNDSIGMQVGSIIDISSDPGRVENQKARFIHYLPFSRCVWRPKT
jgi:hypothetical protein